jgi:antitoxin MazE
MAIKARIVRIANPQGLRIPRGLLEQAHLPDQVELEVRHDHIVIRSARRPRAGWNEQFRVMAQHGDDQLLDGDAPGLDNWDTEEWDW